MIEAYKIAATLSLTSNHRQVFQSLAQGLLGIKTKISDLEGGFNRVKFAIAGMGAAIAGEKILKGLFDIAKHGENLLDQQQKLRSAGVAQNDVLRLTSQYYKDIAKSIPTAAVDDYLRTVNELRTVVGSLKEAEAFAPSVLKMQAVIGNATGKSADREGYNLLRSLELKGITASDPELTKTLLSSFAQAVSASGGKVSAADFFQIASKGGMSFKNAVPEFLTGVMPTVIGDLGGQQAGTAMMTAWMKLSGAQLITKVGLDAMRGIGLIDESHVKKMGMGRFQLEPGAIRGSQEYLNDPYTWSQKFLAPALQNNPDQNGRDMALAQMFGNRNAIKFFMMMSDPGFVAQIEKDRVLRGQAFGVAQAYGGRDSGGVFGGEGLFSGRDGYSAGYTAAPGVKGGFVDNNPKGVEEAFAAQWKSLLEAVGAPLMQAAIPVMQMMTKEFTAIGKWANEHGTAIQRIGEGLAIFGGAAVIAGITALTIALGPIGLAIIGIGALSGVIVAMWDKIKVVLAGIGDAFTTLQTKLAAFFDWLSGLIKGSGWKPGQGFPGQHGAPQDFQGGFLPGAYHPDGSGTPAPSPGNGRWKPFNGDWNAIGNSANAHPLASLGGGSGPSAVHGGLGSLGGQSAYLAYLSRNSDHPNRPGDTSYLHPELARHVAAFIAFARTHGFSSAHLGSGYRPPSFHSALGDRSMHNIGGATDVFGAEGAPTWMLEKFGLYRPWHSAHERNHMQMIGSPKWAPPGMAYDMSTPEGRRRAWEASGPLPSHRSLRHGHQPIQVHSEIHIDGHKIAKVVTHHQTRHQWAPRQAPYHDSYGSPTSPDIGFETG